MSVQQQILLGVGAVGDPYFSNVISLLHMDGANGTQTYTDQKGKTWTAGSGTPVLSSSVKKYGSASLGDGNGGIGTPDHSDWNFGSGDFTIEFWALSGGAPASFGWFLDKAASGGFAPFGILVLNNGSIHFDASFNGTTFAVNIQSSAGVFAFDGTTWHHIAFVRNGNNWYAFVNGTQVGTTNQSGTLTTNAADVTLFTNDSDTQNFFGFIDDFRVTKGVARYTAGFTPPIAAFPDF